MGKLYWTLVVLVIASGVGIVLNFGLKGRTIPKIKWAYFANAQEASDAAQLRLRQEFMAFNLVFIGPHPENELHIETSLKFISWLRTLGNNVLIADPRLSEKSGISADLSLNLMTEKERFLTGLRQTPQGYRVIVWAPNLYVTHVLTDSPISQIASDLRSWNYGVLSFTTFPANRESEAEFEIPCQTGDADASGLSQLGCFIRGQARPHYRKPPMPGKIPGFLNHVRSREYMFFLGN